jgi:hypothetical protein
MNSKKPISETHKELIDTEWDYEKNNGLGLDPTKLTYGSNKKAWWKCEKEHKWKTKIYVRSRGSGCPYCTGQKVCEDNCLQTKNTELVKEWNYEKNNKLGVYPTDITSSSNKKVWWECEKGHEWEAVINHRNSNGCPYCAGKKVCGDNCLLTKNPELAKEWHPTLNNKLTPHDVTCYSAKKVWWVCSKGHEWEAVVHSRSKGYGCPYCSGRKVCKDNCLSTTHPELIKEWDYTKNNILTPQNVNHGSGKKVWWICSKGHEWETSLCYRSRGNGCPKCSIENNSGTNHYNYNPNLTNKEREDRRLLPEIIVWRKSIYKRDNYICQICHHKGGSLNAHHLMNYDKYVELRFDIDNGITLCKKCHNSFHKTYGRKNNTKKQFEEYQLSICKSINSIPILTH